MTTAVKNPVVKSKVKATRPQMKQDPRGQSISVPVSIDAETDVSYNEEPKVSESTKVEAPKVEAPKVEAHIRTRKITNESITVDGDVMTIKYSKGKSSISYNGETDIISFQNVEVKGLNFRRVVADKLRNIIKSTSNPKNLHESKELIQRIDFPREEDVKVDMFYKASSLYQVSNLLDRVRIVDVI